jgi:hypothetical protein
MELLMQEKLQCPCKGAGGGRHGSQLAVERLVQAGLLQFLQVGKFALVEAAEVLGFFAEIGELPGNLPLLSRSNRSLGM